MGAIPEQLTALGAFEELVEPFVGARRDAVPDFFFVDFDELTPAAHAAGLICFREVEFSTDVSKLFEHGESRRDPKCPDLIADDRPAVE